ncbi:MAG: hypothetical protein ACYCS7_11875 [Acidimicrobiales bacterium]
MRRRGRQPQLDTVASQSGNFRDMWAMEIRPVFCQGEPEVSCTGNSARARLVVKRTR